MKNVVVDWAETCTHPALLLYRFADGTKEEKKGEKPLVRDFVKAANGFYSAQTVQSLLKHLDDRQQAQLNGLQEEWDIASCPRKVQWRLVVGLSHGRLWDVSLQLHPLYGITYLPASGIKGALLHWAQEWSEVPATKSEINAWFGTTEVQAQIQVFDAFPLEQKKKTLLREDVLTKHHPKYFETDAKKDRIPPAADYDTPMPVKFISVDRDVRFTIRYAVRKARKADSLESREDLPRIHDLFAEFLTSCGLGAKTRKGYGRMKADS